MASMNYFDCHRSNSTNTIVYFDDKGGNLYLRLLAKLHTIYVQQVGCSIFHHAKFEQTITHQHALLRQENLIDGTVVSIILCLHVLITQGIFISFRIC